MYLLCSGFLFVAFGSYLSLSFILLLFVCLCNSTMDSCDFLCFQVGEFDEDGVWLVIAGPACSPLLYLSVVGVAFGLWLQCRCSLSVCFYLCLFICVVVCF